MRVGLTLQGEQISSDGAKFCAQLGVHDVVLHLIDYIRGVDNTSFMAGNTGPDLRDVSEDVLWSRDMLEGLVSTMGEHGVRIEALENFSPKFWHDILLDGPEKKGQAENLKRLIKDVGAVGIPTIGYNFTLAGIWGWRRADIARGGAITQYFDYDEIENDKPIPDGMVWNMRYAPERPDAPAVTVTSEELWQRLEWFLNEIVPVAEEEGVKLAAHPDDPPTDMLRGTARLVNEPHKYDRLLDVIDSPSNTLEFCVGSLQEMRTGNVYEATRHYAQRGRLGYIHFRNVRGKVPRYEETFINDGDIDMVELIRILRDEGYDGVMVPDHVPDVTCPAPWHAGHGYTVGYMQALIENADHLGPATKG